MYSSIIYISFLAEAINFLAEVISFYEMKILHF